MKKLRKSRLKSGSIHLVTALTNQKCIHEEIKKEQIEVREYLPLFSAKSFVFQFAIHKFKD